MDTNTGAAPSVKGLGAKRRRRLPSQKSSTNSNQWASKMATITIDVGTSSANITHSLTVM